jgi:hypothetical protein
LTPLVTGSITWTSPFEVEDLGLMLVVLDETTIQVHDGPHLLVTATRTTDLVVTHKRAQHH